MKPPIYAPIAVILIPIALLIVLVAAGIVVLVERADEKALHDAECECDSCRDERCP